MKKLTLTLAVVTTLGLGACAGQGQQSFVPVDNGRTAGSSGVVQHSYTDVDRRAVRRTQADRTFDRSVTK